MKSFVPCTILGVTLAGAAALSPLAATAATESDQRVEIVAPSPCATEAVASRQVDAHFQLDNGERPRVRSFGSALRVHYGARAGWTLPQDGRGGFVSPDGQMALRFEMDADGEPQEVVLPIPRAWRQRGSTP